MSKNYLLFLSSLSLLLNSCGTNSEQLDNSICIENDWSAMGLEGRIKHLEHCWHTDLDTLEEGWQTTYDFDSMGFIHHYSFSIDGELNRDVTYVRNDRKEISQAIVKDYKSDNEYKMYYTYDNCKIVDITGFQPDEGNQLDRRQFIYDSLGRTIKVVEYLDGDVQSTEVWTYGENDSYETKRYDKNNELHHRYVQKNVPDSNRYYGSNNNYWGNDDTSVIADFTLTFWDTNAFGNTIYNGHYVGDRLYTRQYNYTYDSLGNWIKYEDHQDSVLWHIYTRNIIYY